ncbi:hypothetical protein F5Y17DRAFT_467846 [Xylariaceae sp. FL0594]|nr:hypothetical protein F5Y17DRAFT_467846 [Xylariaceae sp. FL0594]
MSSFSHPRRTPAVTRPDAPSRDELKLKSNLVLRKGATFHSPISPPASPQSGSCFKVPSLPRRSQTTLDDVIDAHKRRAALNIGRIEDSLAASHSRPASEYREEVTPFCLLGLVGGDGMASKAPAHDGERRVLRPRPRRRPQHHESDSGLGTSIATTADKFKDPRSSAGASTITRSVNTSKTEAQPRLSSRAFSRIHEHVFKPLLAKPSLKEFRPIVQDCPRRIQEKQIVCLRDLEKTLIFMAPERATSAKLYLDFCLTSIRCIQATVEYLSDREQTRPNDRPYTGGYFIDLVDQIKKHAIELKASRDRLAAGEKLDEMDAESYVSAPLTFCCQPAHTLLRSDEIRLVGGVAKTGRPAELVRIKKNGKAVSLATGTVIENLDEEEAKAAANPIRFKRSMSEQAEDDEEIMRSMARRKKNATPEELAPKKCTHPGCTKEFKRPCDLTKHEKTHSRPWKCPIPTCKFHEYGWPTEKEMSRHVNDKHSSAPAMYECQFKPCPYKSKRESNCKQHMEKAHGWTYNRTKVPKKGSKAGSVAQQTPSLNHLPTPDSDQANTVMTPPDDEFLSALGDTHDFFPRYPSAEEFDAGLYDHPPFDDISLEYSPIDNGTPSTDAGRFTFQEMTPDFGETEDIYGALAQVPTPSFPIYDKTVPATLDNNYNTAMYPSAPLPHFSPSGHGNTMLYTPISMVDIDEGFDDFHPIGADHLGGDFTLFPSNNMGKSADYDAALFADMPPSMTAGYTQPSSQDFMDFTMDWTSGDIQSFPEQH